MEKIVPALYRGLAILELLAKEDLGFSQIKNNLNIPKPSLAAILKQLSSQGYIEQGQASKKYRLGKKLLVLAGGLLRRLDIREKARPEVERLRDVCEETIELAVPDGKRIVFVDKLDSPQSIRLFARVVVEFWRLHASAPGKVALAWIEEEYRNDFFKQLSPLPAVTSRTITSKKKLLQQLKEIRALGYAWDNEEAREGVRRFAAPIFDYNKELAGIISIAGPAYRLKISRRKEFSSLVKEAD